MVLDTQPAEHKSCFVACTVLMHGERNWVNAGSMPTCLYFATRQVSKFPLALMFGMCSAFLCLATVCQMRLEHLTAGPEYTAVTVKDDVS